MAFKMAVIADLHDGPPGHLSRVRQFAHVFALRTVHRLIETIRPDAVLVLGDLIDDPDADDALARLTRLKEIFDLLPFPTIALPGNHDPAPEIFYRVFDRPEETVEIGPVRFATFLDPQAPGFNARRLEPELERMRSIRHGGFCGPVVALQHVTAVPPGSTGCCFNYLNMDEVMAGMQSGGVTLSVGGHYHPGTPLVRREGSAYLGVPAMCEAPLCFTEIDLPLDGSIDGIEIQTHHLQVPPELGLFDLHSHTQFAYCSENMHTTVTPQLAVVLGLAGLAFTEHSGQLYFDSPTYCHGGYGAGGLATTQGVQDRTGEYWSAVRRAQADAPCGLLAGFEVDSDFDGSPLLRDSDRRQAQILGGAVHHLPETVQRGKRDIDRLAGQFMAVHERFVPAGIDILVHPFRIFRDFEEGPPRRLFEPLARLLESHDVAAEINFHHNRPRAEFTRLCIDMGVKLTFGSDAHNLYEIGAFDRHLRFLEMDVGYDGDLGDILFSACPDQEHARRPSE